MDELFVDVCLGLPSIDELTYRVPQGLRDMVAVGKRVLVPLRGRRLTGYITALKKEAALEGIKDILEVLDDSPLFDAKRLSFYRWMSGYYFLSLGEVVSLISPPSAEPRSFRYLRLTEEGKRYLKEGGEDSTKEALSKIGTAGGKPITAILKGMGRRRGARTLIERLKQRGLVTEELRLKGAREKRALLVRLKEEPSLKENATVQRRVVECLKERGGWVGTEELRAECGNISAALRVLEERGAIETKEVSLVRDPLSGLSPESYSFKPTPEQHHAIEEIKRALDGGFSAHLLWGVTGSGKTLVYLEAIAEALRRGRRALFLVPEIALTLKPATYLMQRFPRRVALVHSALSEGERFDTWQRIVRGEIDVVVGTRSALFVPLKELGIIIVDEEHDPSYKQEESPRYNARDCALMLAKTLGAAVVLGSATPSVETYYNTKRGRVRLLRLGSRVAGAGLPEVELVDMRKEEGLLSKRLVELMEGCIERGEQAMLFLNRRGFSNFLLCRGCGYVPRCPNCAVSLTLHRGEGLLKCHYCEFARPTPGLCPECGGYDIRLPGAGTERLEEEVKGLFPEVELVRIDRDTVRRKGTLKELIERVESRGAQILVGTQMVSKGHHFPDITLVGVVSADVSLNIADFRSAERTFQLLLQAAGRAGRGCRPARVVVQTYLPEHPCFVHLKDHDYEGFLEEELAARRDAHYPPYRRLALLRVEGTSEKKVLKAAELLKELCHKAAALSKGIEVLGPVEPVPPRLRGKLRRQALLKAVDARALNGTLSALVGELEARKPAGVALVVDVDPVFTG